METVQQCPKGHRWQVHTEGAVRTVEYSPVCPVCGQPAVTPQASAPASPDPTGETLVRTEPVA